MSTPTNPLPRPQLSRFFSSKSIRSTASTSSISSRVSAFLERPYCQTPSTGVSEGSENGSTGRQMGEIMLPKVSCRDASCGCVRCGVYLKARKERGYDLAAEPVCAKCCVRDC